MTERVRFFVGNTGNLRDLENEIHNFLKDERGKYGEIEIRESGVALYGTTIIFYIRYRTR